MCHIKLFASMAHITAQCHSVFERIIIYQILFVRSKLNKSSIKIFVSTLQCSALVSLRLKLMTDNNKLIMKAFKLPFVVGYKIQNTLNSNKQAYMAYKSRLNTIAYAYWLNPMFYL